MSKSSLTFDHFNTLVLRVANLSVQNYTENKQNIFEFYKNNEIFKLSILTSSQSLYNDINKSKVLKYKNSLNKYFDRIHFNPVPFGLFSSVDILKYNNSQTSLKKNCKSYVEFSWDHHFLSKKILKSSYLEREELIFYTNPTIKKYQKSKISFIKTKLIDGGILKEENVFIDDDENVSWLIAFFREGKTANDFITELISSGFNKEEVVVFFNEIIEQGLIIDDYLFHPYENSKDAKLNNFEIPIIKDKYIDAPHNLCELESLYLKFLNDVKDNTAIDNKNYVSITTFDEKSGSVNSDIQEKLERYIAFNSSLNIDYTPINKKLKKFGYEYYHLFCDGLTSLNKVFDATYGIDYGDKTVSTEKNRLITPEFVNRILTSKDIVRFESKDYILKMNTVTEKFPSTFGVMYELLWCEITKKEIIYIKSLGGTSALPMLSRFQKRSNDLCKEIAQYEEEIYKNSILAEINYIPQTRAKNIFAKEQYYQFSIAINTIPVNNNLTLDDLFLNFDGNQFHLFSKKHQKKVVPRITSAIDSSHNNNNLYKFLCDLQYQEGEIYSLDFDFNHQQTIFIEYVPRFFLDEDILLYPAQLLISLNNTQDFNDFKLQLFKKLEHFGFSENILIPDEKGYLMCNSKDDESIINLYNILKRKNNIYIKEHIYESYFPLLKDKEGHSYCHEIISCVKNKKYIDRKVNNLLKYNDEYNLYSPFISEWFFLEIYCKKGSENDILSHFKDVICSSELFFFVRYNNPQNHIRLRFKTARQDIINDSIGVAGKLKQELMILDYKICPYIPELSRYGGSVNMDIAERFFHFDSKDYLENFIYKSSEIDIVLYNLNKVQNYFEKFKLSLDEMHMLCDINIESFSKEFNFDLKMRKAFNKEYAELKNYINISKTLFTTIGIEDNSFHSISNKFKYISDLIHMGLNRSFEYKQRLNEFKIYYFTKLYLNKIRFLK